MHNYGWYLVDSSVMWINNIILNETRFTFLDMFFIYPLTIDYSTFSY